MKRLCKSRACRGRRRATIKRADAEAIQIKGPQKEEKGDNKGTGCRGYTNHGRAHRRMRRATIKRPDAVAIQIKGLYREGKGDNKESGCRGYTNQGPAEGGEGRQ